MNDAKSKLQVAIESHIGKTISGVEMLLSYGYGGSDVGFQLQFTDGTSIEVSSKTDAGTVGESEVTIEESGTHLSIWPDDRLDEI